MMSTKIKLLDCTLRDGAYITESHFGTPVIKGIIKKMQDARVDIIECGWLKDKPHESGSSFFHIPSDLEPYLIEKSARTTYVTMIDWDRYDTDNLPQCDGRSIDAIRVVFPHGRHREGIEVGRRIRAKGYEVFFQAANTLAYSNRDLIDLAECMNEFKPVSLSVVDTFGAMYKDDLERIVRLLDSELEPEIKLGFHSHNNQQLSFALTIHFCELLQNSVRDIVVDASLCGMGRGAGNATLELVASYLDKKQHGNYDLDEIMDAIDVYMHRLQEKYSWGYSIPYFISGLYQCHVNNIAYLLKNHRTNARDMRGVISSLSQDARRKYDYDLLEQKYIEHQSRQIDDHEAFDALRQSFDGRTLLLLAPGKSIDLELDRIKQFIVERKPIVIGVNAIDPNYEYDYVFFVNSARYDYAREVHAEQFHRTKRIVLSNIKPTADEGEFVINFNRAIKRGSVYYDNAMICCLRLMNRLDVSDVVLGGFDGFKDRYNESYADADLPSLNPGREWNELNVGIKELFRDFRLSTRDRMRIEFLTASIFDV